MLANRTNTFRPPKGGGWTRPKVPVKPRAPPAESPSSGSASATQSCPPQELACSDWYRRPIESHPPQSFINVSATLTKGGSSMGKLVVSVSQNAVVQAESAILGCDRCTRGASAPFWTVLDNIRNTLSIDIEVIYILPVLASCPNCGAAIDEITLVEPKQLGSRSTHPSVIPGRA